MEYTIEPDGSECSIIFKGEMNIQDAGLLKTLISDTLDDYSSVMVDLKKVAQIDITCVQILCSSNMTFERDNKILKKINHNREIKNTLVELGFLNNQGHSEGSCKKCV